MNQLEKTQIINQSIKEIEKQYHVSCIDYLLYEELGYKTDDSQFIKLIEEQLDEEQLDDKDLYLEIAIGQIGDILEKEGIIQEG